MMSPSAATPGASRSGITLTEVLISIMIMGVGLISLATLFPLGLVRLRQAMRDSRSTLLAQSAVNEINTRNLLSPGSFEDPFNCPWYASPAVNPLAPNPAGAFDPWAVDPAYPNDQAPSAANRLVRVAGAGLPVCYDPLWRAASPNLAGGAGVYPAFPSVAASPESRFACGIDTVRLIAGRSSAAGLQRITNFDVNFPSRATYLQNGLAVPTVPDADILLAQIFTSTDDLVFNSAENARTPGFPSPLVPDQAVDLGTGVITPPLGDWMFTWFFTGQRSDVNTKTLYEGDIVVCHNRPFGLEPPVEGAAPQAAGERVVEAVWGYGGILPPGTVGYPLAGERSVLLRWPSNHPDPDVRVGGWIADVTYERTLAGEALHTAAAFNPTTGLPIVAPVHPAQRCHWYQVVRKTEVTTESAASPAPASAGNYRRMIVTVNTKLRSRTLHIGGSPTVPNPNAVEAALIMPSVVNVFPKSFTAR